MNNLECSSKGDKRFSAFYANVEAFGVYQSIENHYQDCKYKDSGSKCKKGEKVDYIKLGGRKLKPKYLTPYYKMLWIKYFDNNPELLEYVKDFDSFSDMFKGKSINCQADVISELVKSGREYVLKDCKELINILND